MNTARRLIRELPLDINDAARLILEATEALGERVNGLERREMLLICAGFGTRGWKRRSTR